MELVPGARVKDCGKWDEGVCGSITKNTCEHTHTQTHTHTYTHTHVHVHVPSGCCSVLVSDYEGGFTRTICVEAITKLWLIPQLHFGFVSSLPLHSVIQKCKKIHIHPNRDKAKSMTKSNYKEKPGGKGWCTESPSMWIHVLFDVFIMTFAV